MKKIIFLCFSIFLLIGCVDEDSRCVTYELNEGDVKLMITRDYIIIDTLYQYNNIGNGNLTWRFKETISRSDSAACHELLENLLER